MSYSTSILTMLPGVCSADGRGSVVPRGRHGERIGQALSPGRHGNARTCEYLLEHG